MSDSLLLVGRGDSAYRFDFSTWSGPIMAVSSGVFALPETVMPQHVVTMDEPKFFLDGLSEGIDFAWQEDEYARIWPFWREPAVSKETLEGRVHVGKCRYFPGDAIDALPEDYREPFIRAMAGKLHEYGYQPGWGDFPSVRGWPLDRRLPLNFEDDGKFGLDDFNNSLLMAVQVARRLGYLKLYFIGIDLTLPLCFAGLVERLKKWYGPARTSGMEWINLSPTSRLQEFLPSADHQDDSKLRFPGIQQHPRGWESNGLIPRRRRVCDVSRFAEGLPSSRQRVETREKNPGGITTLVARRVRRKR